jgi:hypothetical protein
LVAIKGNVGFIKVSKSGSENAARKSVGALMDGIQAVDSSIPVS